MITDFAVQGKALSYKLFEIKKKNAEQNINNLIGMLVKQNEETGD